jgi:hypothetical protein
MASKQTWIWVIVGVVGVCMLGLFVLAGAGMYFVSHHISAVKSTAADALDQFDHARAPFKGQRPLIEVDDLERERSTRPLSEMPTSTTRPQQMWVLAWNPNEEPPRLVRVSIPFWILRLGHRKFDVMNGDRGLDFDRMHLDINELERIGPALVMDYSRMSGERVLIWTQ